VTRLSKPILYGIVVAMDKFDRIYCLHQVLESHHTPVSLDTICERLECSIPTAKRLIREMRDYLNAPIVNKRGEGYFYDRNISFQMPGLWFNAGEMQALLAIHSMMSHIGPGFLDEHIHPLIRRIEKLLEKASPETLFDWSRFRILGMACRKPELPVFPLISYGLLVRKKIRISYHGRERDLVTEREVSPQRLTHYRDNWYLDGWCHDKGGLRTFSLDRIRKVSILQHTQKEIPVSELDEHLVGAYGIFSGRAQHTAVLRFTAAMSRWVADESWHPEQQGRFREDGTYELKVPYNNPTELIMDICRYGPEVTVMAPPELRSGVAERLRRAALLYD